MPCKIANGVRTWLNDMLIFCGCMIPVSSSARNLGFIFDSDMSLYGEMDSDTKSCQLSHPRHRSNPSGSSSFCSHRACKFPCLQQTGLLQFILNWHAHNLISGNFNAFYDSLARVSYKHFKISTHQACPEKTRLDSNGGMDRLETLSSHIHDTHKSTVWNIFTIVFHFGHTLFLHDLLIHSFYPFHMSNHHLAIRAISVIGPRILEFTTSRNPMFDIIYKLSVPDSKHTSSKLHSLPRKISHHAWTVYLDLDSCWSSILCPIEWHTSVRYRAIRSSLWLCIISMISQFSVMVAVWYADESILRLKDMPLFSDSAKYDIPTCLWRWLYDVPIFCGSGCMICRFSVTVAIWYADILWW